MSFCFCFSVLTSIHTLEKKKTNVWGGEGGGKEGGGPSRRVTVCRKKHLHGVETMSRFQVARGQSSKEGDASCPVPSEYSTFLLLRGALLLLLRPSPAHLPRCVPGSHNIVKAVILLSNVALYKHQIPRLPPSNPSPPPHPQPPGSLVPRSALFWREDGRHANRRGIMGG